MGSERSLRFDEFEFLFQCRRSPKEKPMSTRERNLLYEEATSGSGRLGCPAIRTSDEGKRRKR